MIVIALIAVLSGVAIALLSGGHAQSAAQEAACRVAADVAFAQADAIAHRAARAIVFDAAGESYAVYAGGVVQTHPVSKLPFRVDLASATPGARVDLQLPNFGGGDTLSFSADGTPASGGKVDFRAGGSCWRVTVSELTGHVSVAQVPLLEAEPVVE